MESKINVATNREGMQSDDMQNEKPAQWIGVNSQGEQKTIPMSWHDARCWLASPLTKGAYPGARLEKLE